MSDNSNPTYLGLYLSGNFEIEDKTSTENGWRAEYRTYTTYIGCGGADRDKRLLYEIKAKGFSLPQHSLSKDRIYFLRGSFFPSNSEDTSADQLVFEAMDKCFVAEAEGWQTDLVDTVGVTGRGVVTGISTIVESCCQIYKKKPNDPDLQTTVLTVEHAEYHPVRRLRCVSKIEYLIRPTPGLARIPSMIRIGRECQFHGYIKDFNQVSSCYIVVANRVYLTTGFQQQPSVAKSGDGKPNGALQKPVKFKSSQYNSQFKSPTTIMDSAVGIQTAHGQFTPSSLASTSGSSMGIDSATFGQESNTETPSQRPAKRGRKQPKRKNSKEKASDLE